MKNLSEKEILRRYKNHGFDTIPFLDVRTVKNGEHFRDGDEEIITVMPCGNYPIYTLGAYRDRKSLKKEYPNFCWDRVDNYRD